MSDSDTTQRGWLSVIKIPGAAGGGAWAHRRRQRADLRADARGAAASQAGALPLAAAARQGAQDRRRGRERVPGMEPPETVHGPTAGGSVRISGPGPVPSVRLLPRPGPSR